MSQATYRVIEYTALRHKVNEYHYPDAKSAMLWAVTELGEASDELLMKSSKWARNNPSAHPPFDKDKFGAELGDVIMMLIEAGLAEGVDPIECMYAKMDRKLREIGYVPGPDGRGWSYVGDGGVEKVGVRNSPENGDTGTV